MSKITLSISFLASKLDQEFNSLIDNETPLSLLEECYTCIFSVAKYYTVNSIEPFRFISNNLTNEKTKSIQMASEVKSNLETIFFGKLFEFIK